MTETRDTIAYWLKYGGYTFRHWLKISARNWRWWIFTPLCILLFLWLLIWQAMSAIVAYVLDPWEQFTAQPRWWKAIIDWKERGDRS